MADNISAKIEGKAIPHYKRLPEDLRARLRSEIPFLTKQLASRVREKLAPGALFKTTDHILPAVNVEMVENSREIYGRVYIDPKKFPNVVAHTLESGSRPHEIAAVNAPMLVFFWAKVGQVVAFKRVHHPGFEGRSYMKSSADEMKDELVGRVSNAVTGELHGRS